MMRGFVSGRAGRPWQHRVLHVFGVVSVLLIALAYCSPHADAATGAPVTTCGSTVTYTVEFESLAPTGAGGAVRWAYAQVAPVARVAAKQTDTGKVRWEWPDPMSGVSATSGDTWQTSLSNGRYRLHSHRLDGVMATAILRQQALRDVLRDLSVRAPTSTATGLNAGDRKALSRTCVAQGVAAKTRAGSKAAAKPPVSTDVDTAKSGGHASPTVPMVAPAITNVAAVIALLLAVGLGVYLIKPSVAGRVAELARARRGRVAGARKASPTRDSDTTDDNVDEEIER